MDQIINQPVYFLILRAVQLLFGFIVFCIAAAFIHGAVTDELVLALVCVSKRVIQRLYSQTDWVQGTFHFDCRQFQHNSQSSHCTSKTAYYYSDLDWSGCHSCYSMAYFNG